jgi:hypothetical protein
MKSRKPPSAPASAPAIFSTNPVRRLETADLHYELIPHWLIVRALRITVAGHDKYHVSLTT